MRNLRFHYLSEDQLDALVPKLRFNWAAFVIGTFIGIAIIWGARCASGQQPTAGLTREQAIELLQKLPPGSEVTFEQTNQEAQGVGAGFRGDGSQIKGEFNASAPAAGLEGLGNARGSGVDSSFTLKGADNPAIRIVVAVLGVLIMLAGGGGGVYLQNRRLALAGFGVGGALVMVAIFPQIFLWGVLAALAVAVGFLIWAEYEAKLKHESLVEVVSGTYQQGAGAVQGLFDALGSAQGSRPNVMAHVQDLIAKERLGVPSARPTISVAPIEMLTPVGSTGNSQAMVGAPVVTRP